MLLYLSSFRLGTEPEHLVRLVGGGSRIAVLANAIDAEPGDVRAAKVADEVRALERLGLRAEEVDLRRFFDVDPHDVVGALDSYDGLWVRGGNVFVLRCALALSAGDQALRTLLADDRLVYAGYSAGPCVLAPSLEGLEAVDDVTGPSTAYGVPHRTDGLGVLDRRVVPHAGSAAHPEGVALDEVARRYEASGIAHLRLRDGEALVVDGRREQVVGRPAEVAELLYDES